MRNVRLLLQYDGTGYHGWQIQPNGITIQGVLQDRLNRITGQDTSVTGAGRTDAGVHALGQVASFKTSSHLPADTLMRALNALLPDDIRIMEAGDESAVFHPRYDAHNKTYFYMIAMGNMLSPFLHRYAWRLPYCLDSESMAEAAKNLVGRHDFTSFRATGCGAKSPVRTVSSVSVERCTSLDFMTAELKGDFLKVQVEGDAFLRHMVRAIVGTLVECGKGKTAPGEVGRILRSLDRNLAGPTAPAKGLFLKTIRY